MAQPLLLTSMFRQDFNDSSAARNSASSTSSSSSLHRRSSPLKRDSAVSIKHAGSRSDVRRTSMRRSFQSSEAAFVEDDLAKFLAEQPAQTMGHKGPVYRLYPHQTTSGRRELAASQDINNSHPASRLQEQRSPKSTALACGGGPEPSKLTSHAPQGGPAVHDFEHRRHPSSASSHPSSPKSTSTLPYHASSSPPRKPTFTVDSDAEKAPKTLTRNKIQIPPRISSSAHSSDNDNTTANSIDGILHRMPSTGKHPATARDSFSEPTTPDTMNDTNYGTGDHSSRDSRESIDTSATSIHTLPPLQTKGPDNYDMHQLEPLMEDDPRSFDLLEPEQEAGNVGIYELEKQAMRLLSNDHLSAIFANSKLLLKFTGFLNSHRPQSIPVLIYYLDALKALRAIKYANAVAEALEPIASCEFTRKAVQETGNSALEEKANKAFDILVREDLPAYISYTWIQVVSTSIARRITGTLAPHLREASEGLAEVFCLSDPSRPDNPIVFASEEFSRTTQYGMNYSIGRNCRFLQGPKTDPNSPRRLAMACAAGKEQTEVFVNYRRDGSPFMNLLMIAPLMDSKGDIRYFLGAQVDVSGLLKTCTDLPGLAKLVDDEYEQKHGNKSGKKAKKDQFQELAEMFNSAELETVRRSGGRMHREYVDDSSDSDSVHNGTTQRPRLMLSDPTQDILDKQKERIAPGVPAADQERINGKLAGVYQHYLLVRPAPSLRILFTSPSLRVPGILQSPFLHRIGGSPRVRADLEAALGEGRGVTAKIRWLARPDEDGEGDGRPRWIHCTPLLGHTGAVGVWMIVLVDEEGSRDSITANRRFRTAPPVPTTIVGSGDHLTAGSRNASGGERRHLNAYDMDAQRRGAGSGTNAPNSANYYANFNGSNSNLHSSAAAIDRRPSGESLSGPLTSSREYPPSMSQFSLHARHHSPASSTRARSMTRRNGGVNGNGANYSALEGHVASQINAAGQINATGGYGRTGSQSTASGGYGRADNQSIATGGYGKTDNQNNGNSGYGRPEIQRRDTAESEAYSVRL